MTPRAVVAVALFAFVAFPGSGVPEPTTPASPMTVSAEALRNAGSAADGWLVYGRDLSAHRFSPLAGIDTTNVAKLTLAWTRTLGKPVSMEGTPLVAGTTMYVTTGKGDVFALDATNGAVRWHYARPLPDDISAFACCNFNNRGVTLHDDEVIEETLDAHLVALDRAGGQMLWDLAVAPYHEGYSITSPPLPVGDMLVTGVAGGEFPIRGFIAAVDAKTGRQRWRTYTIPSRGEPGYETWKIPGSAEVGGAPTWVQGTYDAQLDTIYWGVGNPNPDFDPHGTAGDVLYTDSLLALDARTGRIRWHYKFTPSDYWDYDGVNEPVLVDLPMRGTTVKALAHADRNGYLYVIDRISGKLLYVEPFVDRVTWAQIERTTGIVHPNERMRALADAGKPFISYPGNMGGKNWGPTAYDPRNHLYIIPTIEGGSVYEPQLERRPSSSPWERFLTYARSCLAAVGRWGRRADAQLNLGGTLDFLPLQVHGAVAAYDLTTGKRVWKTHFRSPIVGGVLATAGGLVFAGNPEGELMALDEESGRVLWRAKTASGVTAPPISYAVDGEEYVAVEVGTGGPWAGVFAGATPWLRSVPLASIVSAYRLPRAAR